MSVRSINFIFNIIRERLGALHKVRDFELHFILPPESLAACLAARYHSSDFPYHLSTIFIYIEWSVFPSILDNEVSSMIPKLIEACPIGEQVVNMHSPRLYLAFSSLPEKKRTAVQAVATAWKSREAAAGESRLLW